MQQNRLTVIGEGGVVRSFHASTWYSVVGGRYYDPLELSPVRHVCQFETDTDPLPVLRQQSRRQPGLVLLLEYEKEGEPMKGLAKVKNGRVSRRELRY